MKKVFVLVLIIVSLGLIRGYTFYSDALSYSLDPGSESRVVFDVKEGATAQKVGQDLYSAGLIKSPFVFGLYLKHKKLAGQIKAGRMILKKNMDLRQIADTLITGISEELSVRLLEGWTVKQIADYLESLGLTTSDSFLDCIKNCEFDFDFLPDDYLEGYLYPDTYFVDPSSYSDEKFISRSISNFESRVYSPDTKGLEKSNISLEQAVIMASIVEREENDPDERPVVAGILWNRFNSGAGLGADATVLYALGRTKGGLSYNDLQIDSPYNTRKYRGLPPTPICNPSISSIRAAMNPADTDFWYYLHDADGNVHYGSTLEEHNVNKRNYIY